MSDHTLIIYVLITVVLVIITISKLLVIPFSKFMSQEVALFLAVQITSLHPVPICVKCIKNAQDNPYQLKIAKVTKKLLESPP